MRKLSEAQCELLVMSCIGVIAMGGAAGHSWWRVAISTALLIAMGLLLFEKG